MRLVLHQTSNMSDPFVEVVGKVEEADLMVMLASTDLGSDFSTQLQLAASQTVQ